MLKKTNFATIAIVAGLMIIGIFTACKGGGAGGDPGGSPPLDNPIGGNPTIPNPGGNDGGGIIGGGYDGGGDPDTNPANKSIIVTNTDEWNAALITIIRGGNGTAGNPKTYTITISGTFMVNGSVNYSFGSVSYVTVKLNGNGKMYLIGQGSLLTINVNQAVIIDSSSLTLEGLRSGQNGSALNNTRSIISVAGGVLELWDGTIRGNTGNSGVYVTAGTMQGRFTMSGGSINDNINTNSEGGGGVYIDANCSFTMTGGTISDNKCNSYTGMASNYRVGGVYNRGTFDMSGGTISGNTGSEAGGVYNIKTFDMSGGSISNNSATNGGGVYGSLDMSGGSISNNSATNGGGVYGSLDMSGGIISGNTAKSNGGGLYNYNAGSRLVNGEISDNIASSGKSLYLSSGAKVYYGYYNGVYSWGDSKWYENGTLNTTDLNIKVVNGVLSTY